MVWWLLITSFQCSEKYVFPMYANSCCDAGQVPIFRYFEACRGG